MSNKKNKLEGWINIPVILDTENHGSNLLDSREKSVFIKNLNFEDYKNLLNIINGENGTI